MALGAQAVEARLRNVLEKAGFSRIRRAAETPFNMIIEARPWDLVRLSISTGRGEWSPRPFSCFARWVEVCCEGKRAWTSFLCSCGHLHIFSMKSPQPLQATVLKLAHIQLVERIGSPEQTDRPRKQKDPLCKIAIRGDDHEHDNGA
jgi:hypothetical protein